jgi:hypothetical protein
MRITRPSFRYVSTLIVALVLSVPLMMFAYSHAPTQAHAQAPKSSAALQTPAVDLSAKGPSVGVDVNNNQFVFWKGSTNTKLREAVYTADTGSWSNGTIDLRGVGPDLASQPSVAVANFGGFLSGGHRYGA